MGDLKGHALPGSLFMFFGIWWGCLTLRKYYTCRRDGARYRNTASFQISIGGRALPLEAYFKIFLSGSGICVEILSHLPMPPMPIVQHATMYFFFLLSGCFDLASFYSIPLPPGSDYLALGLAFTVEGVLFANHLHGRPILDVHIHVLLVYVIAVTVVVLVMECRYRQSAMLSLCRSFLTIVQGSWFWAVGIILYGHGGEGQNTAWEMDKPEEVMLSTIYFSWHCGVIFILLFCLTILMAWQYVGFRSNKVQMGHNNNNKQHNQSQAGFTRLKMEEEGEGDVEEEEDLL